MLRKLLVLISIFTFGSSIYAMSESDLHRAAMDGDIRKVSELIATGADLDNQAERSGQTALIYAIRNGHFEVAKALIDAGADINKADYDWVTPLTHAEKEGQAEIAALLRDKGAERSSTRPPFEWPFD